MDKYEVIGSLGEGSFGRVYKAKRISDSTIVALKVISKRGRSSKELKGLRRECEIQRHLNHPNIVQMFDSFESENEIVVITEFAHKELYVILGKEGFLPEERVQTIVWDLVSALYYLHSNRVLHRDLKPQNILLDVNNCAKLCDFGFARNMSTGTHVLTSIKGTPLYMAPELIEEHPYDHSADLWSLGCIIYELLVGAPPFCTTSILHLIRLIKYEQIQWPRLVSENCISFLQGLLQKDPSKRMTWTEILQHPFVEGHILITDDCPTMPLTKPLPPLQMEAKEKQLHDLGQKAGPSKLLTAEVLTQIENRTRFKANSDSSDTEDENLAQESSKLTLDETKPECEDDKGLTDPPGVTKTSVSTTTDELKCPTSRDGHLNKLSQNLDNFAKKISKESKTSIGEETKQSKSSKNEIVKTCDIVEIEDNLDSNKTPTKQNTLENWNWTEESQPIESEEWLAFLQRSMQEIMGGEMTTLCQPNLTNVIVTPLRNPNASCRVVEYAACLLSLPFVVPGTSEDVLSQIKSVYLEVKLVPNLVYASKILARNKPDGSSSNETTPTPTNTPVPSIETYRSMSDLSADELQALEYIHLLICHLVLLDRQFIIQFCDAVAMLNTAPLLQQFLLLSKRKLRIVTDIIAILTQILLKLPENAVLVEKVILNQSETEGAGLDFVHMLRHSSPVLRARVCCLFRLLARYSCRALQGVWNAAIRETLEALVYDSMENVRNTAEAAVMELRSLVFYEQNTSV